MRLGEGVDCGQDRNYGEGSRPRDASKVGYRLSEKSARRLRAPVRATLVGGAITFVLTVALPFISLVSVTSTITLLVFAGVNLALWRLHRSGRRTRGFRVPTVIPPLAALANVALVLAQLFV